MTAPLTTPTITTVNEMVAHYPNSVSVFNELGIDACCGGDVALAEAAHRDGVDLKVLIDALDDIVERSETEL